MSTVLVPARSPSNFFASDARPITVPSRSSIVASFQPNTVNVPLPCMRYHRLVAGKKSSPKKEWKKYAEAIDAGLRRGSWVEIWEAAGEIVERKLFKEGKYKSANDFFERHMKVDRTVAARNVRIAKYASIED